MSNLATLNRKGRPKGATNLATREKAAREAAAVAMLASQIGDEAVASMGPLEIVLAIARAAWAAGNVSGALAASEVALPYCVAKRGVVGEGAAIPDDLEPDPISEGDEPGPSSPVL
jgi:hypothetical protein